MRPEYDDETRLMTRAAQLISLGATEQDVHAAIFDGCNKDEATFFLIYQSAVIYAGTPLIALMNKKEG